MRHIIITPNAFKGSLSAFDICRILESEWSDPHIRIISLPMGDGGDGTGAIIASYLQATEVKIETCDALGRESYSSYYKTGNTAIIELAAICGLGRLSPDEYDVMNTHTAGLGIAILKAIESGAQKIILCIGGSASIDGGLGALSQMGLTIKKSQQIYKNDIIGIESIDTDLLNEKFTKIEFTVLCDVENPLCGELGAATVFGPQKGASPFQVALLDSMLKRYAGLLTTITHDNIAELKYGGAAGGISASFYALLGAQLVSGADYCLQISAFMQHLVQAHLVITGEGKIDRQSLYGKIPGVIAQRCREEQIPVIAIAGVTEDSTAIFDYTFAMTDYAGNIESSLRDPERYLRLIGKDIKEKILNAL